MEQEYKRDGEKNGKNICLPNEIRYVKSNTKIPAREEKFG